MDVPDISASETTDWLHPGRPGCRRWTRVAATGLAALLTIGAVAGATSSAAAGSISLKVVGSHLVGTSGQSVRMLGANRSGSEYACVQGWGVFDGPDTAQSVAAMAAWKINTVRVPLNEDCWLGINGSPAAYSGAAYRTAISNYVTALHAAGMYAVLDLHWNAPARRCRQGSR